MKRRALATACTAWAVACGNGADEHVPTSASAQRGELPEGVVARVGDDDISRTHVQGIVAKERVTPAEARDRAVRDALWASAAPPEAVRRAERSALARALLEQLKREAESRGPPTDAEVERITERRWLQLARPEAVRTVHAVALLPKDADAAARAKARALAARVRDAVKDTREPDEFEKRAGAVDAEPGALRVERLDPVARDGRVLPSKPLPPGATPPRFDATYAEAVHELEPGDVSQLIETPFGYHVVLLVERLPAMKLSLEERRQLVRDEVFSERAGQLERELVERLRRQSDVAVVRSWDSLTAEVRVR